MWVITDAFNPAFYEILGVKRSATHGDIQKAYRQLARSLHPDIPGHTEDEGKRFKLVNEAYDTLGDPGKKAVYDADLKDWPREEPRIRARMERAMAAAGRMPRPGTQWGPRPGAPGPRPRPGPVQDEPGGWMGPDPTWVPKPKKREWDSALVMGLVTAVILVVGAGLLFGSHVIMSFSKHPASAADKPAGCASLKIYEQREQCYTAEVAQQHQVTFVSTSLSQLADGQAGAVPAAEVHLVTNDPKTGFATWGTNLGDRINGINSVMVERHGDDYRMTVFTYKCVRDHSPPAASPAVDDVKVPVTEDESRICP